jgi:hypothetical protein
MKHLNKFASVFCAAALGMLSLTGCEGGDLYNVDAPDWLADKIAEIAESKTPSGDDELEGMEEDVYTIGATDYSTGWWAQFSKYYQIPAGEKWNAVFNLNINPAASNTYKNFALIICNDEDRGAANYKEYGAIRFDNQPSGNSEWGDYIDRNLVVSTLTFETDTDKGVEKLGGRVVLTIDRTQGGLIVNITNGTVTKTYTQTTELVNLNADASNETIRAFLVPEGSYISFQQSNIEPIGGYTSKEDKQPLSMTLNGAPKKVLLGTTLEEAFANVTATVHFEQEVSKDVTAAELTFQTGPDINTLGTKSLVAVYNKTYKGEGAAKPVIASVQFEVVDKMYTLLGAADNSTPFWGAHTDNIKINPGETFVSTFTNYTSGANNWNNFCVVLCSADGSTEYAVVRADNYGWGTGYDACTHEGNQGDWATWLAAMDGAKVTLAVTNNGKGTADIEATMVGNNGEIYTQVYKGINTVDPNNCYFNLTVDNCHLEFDDVVGAEDNSSPFWGAHSTDISVPVGKTITQRFRNYTNGANNWNNFCVVLTREDNSEYAVVRADNFGWGASYDNNSSLVLSGGQADWGTWLAAMDEALVTVSTTNKGGSVDVDIVMIGNDGKEYIQYYHNITPTDGDNVRVRFTVDGSHLVFE